jgi:hypothetical protein
MGEVDLTPGLESISVAFAHALLASPDTLRAVTVQTLASVGKEGSEEKMSRETFVQGFSLKVHEQLGLPVPEAVTDKPPAKEYVEPDISELEKILYKALEKYLEANKTSEANASASVDANDGGSTLTCRLLSSEELRIKVSPGMSTAELKMSISQTRGVPTTCIGLVSSDGELVNGTVPVMEAFPDLEAVIAITTATFEKGDRVKAFWASGKIKRAENNTFTEKWYGGIIRDVKTSPDTDEKAYDIVWDDNTQSLVHCEGAIWRTAHGGLIYALEKGEDTRPPEHAAPSVKTEHIDDPDCYG